MRRLITLLVCVLFATSMIVAVGCGKKEEPAKPAAQPAEPAKAAEPEKKAEEVKPEEPAKTPEPAATPEKK